MTTIIFDELMAKVRESAQQIGVTPQTFIKIIAEVQEWDSVTPQQFIKIIAVTQEWDPGERGVLVDYLRWTRDQQSQSV